MIKDILLGISSSLVASVVFWVFTFWYSPTKIRFSSQIEKSTDSYDKSHKRYRIKLLNIGRRDLLEVTYIVRLSISTETSSGEQTTNNTYLGLGYSDVPPVFHGKKWQNINKGKNAAWILPLLMIDSTYSEFSKRFYPENIQKAAKDKSLTLDDVFQEFKDRIGITIYAFGFDAITGARKMFQSKWYSTKDIKQGTFNKPSDQIKSYNDYVDHILTVSNTHSKA